MAHSTLNFKGRLKPGMPESCEAGHLHTCPSEGPYTSTLLRATVRESVSRPPYTFRDAKLTDFLHFFDPKTPDFPLVLHFYTFSTKRHDLRPDPFRDHPL